MLLVSVYFAGLGSYPLLDPDEARNVEIAREALVEGKWLPPTVHGRVRYEKPPLYYWVLALSLNVLGVNEYSGRVLSVVSTIIVAMALFFMARDIFYFTDPWIPASIYLTFPITYVYARVSSMEPFLLALISLSILFYLYWENYGRFTFIVLSFFFVALSFNTKGPVALFIYGLFVIIYRLVNKKGFPKPSFFITFMLIMTLFVAPLFLLLEKNYPGYIYEFFIKENFTRYTSDVFHRNQPFYYYLGVLFLGSLSLLIFKDVILDAVYRFYMYDNRKFVSIALFISAIIIFFSMSKSKLPHYVLIIFPLLTLISFYNVEINSSIARRFLVLCFVMFLFSSLVMPFYINKRYDLKDKLRVIVARSELPFIYYRGDFYSVSFYTGKVPLVVGSRDYLVKAAKDLRNFIVFVDKDKEREVFHISSFCSLREVVSFRIKGHSVKVIDADCL